MSPEEITQLLEVAYAYGRPEAHAVMRSSPEDFRVDEVLGFEPSNEGQHRLLLIEKRNTNTEWVAKQLARYCDIPPRDVSYAGMKDREAVTTQWFSIDLAGRPEPDWSGFNTPDYRVLASHAHNKKLRRGSLQGNRFVITLRELSGDREALERRLQQLRKGGVPNYFGAQRFGHQGDNLLQAWQMLQGQKKVKDRNRRSIYLSAARSLIFNRVLSRRVAEGSWQQVLEGEAAMLAGSSSYFCVESVDDVIRQRLQAWDIHPSGPMWGRGRLASEAVARELEEAVCAELAGWLGPLEQAGLKQERRALRLQVAGLHWQWSGESVLSLEFELPAGSYATSVIRELVQL